MSLLSSFIQLKFNITSHDRAVHVIRNECDRSIAIAESVSTEKARQPINVPSMLGVDEDMQDWSLFQVLEHNAIVNRQVSKRINSLIQETEWTSNFDPKKDVMPSNAPGAEQVQLFRKSVDDHLEIMKTTDRNLRATTKARHPVFGMLNAHQWNGMFGFHLMLHRKQMSAILKELNA